MEATSLAAFSVTPAAEQEEENGREEREQVDVIQDFNKVGKKNKTSCTVIVFLPHGQFNLI